MFQSRLLYRHWGWWKWIVFLSQNIHPGDSALHFGCSQVCGGSHPLQYYMHLQCRRVRSLNFLPVAVAGSRITTNIPFRKAGRYNSTGCNDRLSVSEPFERLSHTDTSPPVQLLVTQCAHSGTWWICTAEVARCMEWMIQNIIIHEVLRVCKHYEI